MGKSRVLGMETVLFGKMTFRCFAKMGETKMTNNSMCLLEDKERRVAPRKRAKSVKSILLRDNPKARIVRPNIIQ